MSDQNYLETYDLRRVWNRAIQYGSLWPHMAIEHLKRGQSSPNRDVHQILKLGVMGGGDVKTSKFFILITIEIFWIYLIIP